MPDPLETYQSLPSSERQTLDRLAIAVDRAYSSTGRLLWRSFLQGMMSALGAAIGTVVVLSVLGFLFQKLGGPAVLQSLVGQLSQSIAQAQVHTFLGR